MNTTTNGNLNIQTLQSHFFKKPNTLKNPMFNLL